jgi:hypothetical protein
MKTHNFINITFDNKQAGYFFYGQYMGARKLIGEIYGHYVVQFSTLKQAEKAIKSYRKYINGLGFNMASTCYSEGYYADIGNHSAWPITKLDSLKQNFFYIGA